VGDPDFTGLDRDLQPLPHAREEVEALSAAYPEDSVVRLLGAEANEDAVVAAVTGDAPRTLHLATHGLVDPVEPARTCIALAKPAGGSSDGVLDLAEIAALRPTPPLVVLSACETAGGRVERGEGVVGLARAFLAAGSREVVASLWSVADASTAALMGEFYREMRDGSDVATALAGARRTLLAQETTSHPFHWAAFVVVGE
jgi:CHAT domain-containing protein